MIRAELADGTVLEFPDETPGAVVDATVKKHLAPQTAASPQKPAPSFMESVGQGAGDVVLGARQLAANADRSLGLTGWALKNAPWLANVGLKQNAEAINKRIDAREADYQGARGKDAGTDWGRMAGNVGAALPLAALIPGGSSLLGSVGYGIGGGAALSAVEPVQGGESNFYGKKGKQVAQGATIGAVTGPLAFGLGKAIAPSISAEARTLADQGVELTPGQLIGGAPRMVEDALTSLPIIGDAIKGAQTRGIESLNRVAVDKALAPIKAAVGKDVPVGRELVDEAFTKVGAAYTNLLPGLRLAPDAQLGQDIATAISNPMLTPEARASLVRVLQDKVASRFTPGQPITGDVLKKMDSELGVMAANYGKSTLASERDIGAAFGAVKTALKDALARSNPQAAGELAAIDQAYAMLTRVRGAAASAGTDSGVFTPAQLSAAVRAGDKSVGKGRFARGDALMQDLSDAARSVMPSKVPDSGTGRRLIAPAMLGSVAGGASGVLNPMLAAAAGLPLAAYSRPGTRLIQSALTAPRSAGVQGFGNFLAGSGPLLSLPLTVGME